MVIDTRLMASLPTMTEVQKGAIAALRFADTRPPGGQNAQHLTSASDRDAFRWYVSVARLQKGAIVADRLADTSPPGEQNAQHLTAATKGTANCQRRRCK